MSTNNFKKIDEEIRNQHPKAPADIEHNVNSNIHSFTFFGNVVELFIPRIVESLLNILGGGTAHKKNITEAPTTKKNIDPTARGNAKSDEASNRGEIF